jgi:hypothetical protein
MNASTAPRVVSADTTDRGIIVTFADGKCALFNASFLYAKLVYAELIMTMM